MNTKFLCPLAVAGAFFAGGAGNAVAAPGPEGPANCTFANGTTTCASVGDPVVKEFTSSPAVGCTTTKTITTFTTTYSSHRGTYNSNGKELTAPPSSTASTESTKTTCAPIRYEAESLSGTFVNGHSDGAAPDTTFSNNAYAVFRLSPGGSFTATVSVPVDGSYDLTSGDCHSSDTGIYTLSVDGGAAVGPPTDTNNYTDVYCTGRGTVVTDHGTVYLTAGTHTLTQTVTGTTSRGYTLAPDYFELTLK